MPGTTDGARGAIALRHSDGRSGEPGFADGVRRLFDEFTWRHPEWWALLAAIGAWIVIVAAEPWGGTTTHHHGATAVAPMLDARVVLSPLAMMLPLAVTPIRAIAFSNFRYRTDRSIALFLVGYVGMWLLASLLLATGVTLITTLIGPLAMLAVAVAFALLWRTSTRKARALRRCDPLVALASHGWRADRQHLGLGLTVGGTCVVNCWAVMVVACASGHAPLVVVALLVFLLYERHGPWGFWWLGRAVAVELRWARADLRAITDAVA